MKKRDWRKEHEIACQALEIAKERASEQYDLPSSVILFKKIDKNGRVSVGFKDYSSGENFRLIPRKEVQALGVDIDLLPEYTEFSQKYQQLQDAVRNFFYKNRVHSKEVFYSAKINYLNRFYEDRREIYDAYLSSPEWAAKRQQCYQFHGTTCLDCGTNYATDIHHRHYETLGDENPETDIVPLCSGCHEARHKTGEL